MITAAVMIVIIAVALATLRFVPPRRPTGFPEGPVVVVVEPSIFRRAGTYVDGPHSDWTAGWWAAWRAVRANPHAEARVVPASAVVILGRHQLWPEVENADDRR